MKMLLTSRRAGSFTEVGSTEGKLPAHRPDAVV